MNLTSLIGDLQNTNNIKVNLVSSESCALHDFIFVENPLESIDSRTLQ